MCCILKYAAPKILGLKQYLHRKYLFQCKRGIITIGSSVGGYGFYCCMYLSSNSPLQHFTPPDNRCHTAQKDQHRLLFSHRTKGRHRQ